MKRTSTTFPEASRARGFATGTVIAILVMLAVFGTALVTTITTQSGGAGLDIQSARAYQAARAGLEFGMYQALRAASCGTTNINLTGALNGFRVKVECSSNSHTEGATTTVMYDITATGCNDTTACPGTVGPNYVERQLRVTVGSN